MNVSTTTWPESTSTFAPPSSSSSNTNSSTGNSSTGSTAEEDQIPETTPEPMTPIPPKTNQHQQQHDGPIFLQWTQFTSFVHNAISEAVVRVSRIAAEHPKTVVSVATFVALALPLIGFFTNFKMEVEQEAILAPFNSLSRQHHDWIEADSTGFPESTRPFDLLVHADGDNVLTITTMKRVFEALDVFRRTPGYEEICAVSDYELTNGHHTCQIHAATRFWWHNETLFDQEVQTDADMIIILSQEEYPLGTPVGDHDFILGNYEMMDDVPGVNGTTVATLVSAQSYILRIDVPLTEETSNFEDLVVERLLDLREQWENDETIKARLEFFTFRSIPNEFLRAIFLDLPLYPAVFFIMCGFACITFYRKDRVHSRCLLGIGAVATIGLSLLMGCGLMFIIGVPLTNLTGSLAFVVFGVGLDDTFIIMGQYNRTNPRKDVVERVCETMEVVGLSIFVTTLTTMMAFGLGTMSAVPAIKWLCLYALPTIFIDFLFQIGFFISLLVLDERRIQQNKRDCCFCQTVPIEQRERGYTNESYSAESQESVESTPEGEEATDSVEQQVDSVPQDEPGIEQKPSQDQSDSWSDASTLPPKTYQEQFMVHYADFLMRPLVKLVVIVCFLVYLGLALYSATLLEQEFRAEEIVPKDSYVKGFLHSVNDYSVQVIQVGSYFRNVDQSDPYMQEQMRDYMSQLAQLEQIGEDPPFCWVQDFAKFLDQNEELVTESLGELTFNEKLNFALSIPAIKEVYGSDIVRDEDGNITASRCWFFMKNLDMQDVEEQQRMLLDQRAVSSNHPVNQGKPEFAFFSFSVWYIIWEFYTVAINELALTTISGIVAVSIVAFLFIPHWTGVLFVSPLITTLYIDLLGTLQFAGVSVNVVTYVCLVISVGLLVDFLMHVLLRYYESHGQTREAKVRDTLETVGPSILVGGLSTFLGVVPLAFSTNDVAKVVFISFIAMVSLGIGHGLIFLPVLLSLVGPTNTHPRVPNMSSTRDLKRPVAIDDRIPTMSITPSYSSESSEESKVAEDELEEIELHGEIFDPKQIRHV